MLWYVLLALASLAAFLYIVRAYKQRTTAQRAASSKRFEEIFGDAARRAKSNPTIAIPPATGAATVTMRASAASVRTAPAYLRRERLLSAQHAALFRALESALPEHCVFTHVSLAALIDIPPSVQGREREQRLRVLAQHTVDCLVCSRDFEVTAAVDLETGETAESRIKLECLKAAGVRHLRLDPQALPPLEMLRVHILRAQEPL